MKTPGLALALVAAAACTSSPGDDAGVEPLDRVDLRTVTGLPLVTGVGITIDTAGARYIFDTTGIYRLDGHNAATRVMTQEALLQTEEQVQLPFTDIAAVAPGQFAVTAISDGYLVDVNAATIQQHFCYVPEGTPDWLWQRTDALAYDAVNDRIWAQPRTFDTENVLQDTDIASYDRATGVLVSWDTLPLGSLEASAMVVLPRYGLVVAQGSRLLTYDPVAREVREYADLDYLGITAIEGLTRDPVTASLLVLDGPSQQLIELDLAALGLFWPGA